jgi:hypothetical protein
MPERGRADLFEADNEFDVSQFQPKAPAEVAPTPPPDLVRSVSEAAQFRSRDPAAAPRKHEPMLYRTGRNMQFNAKVHANTHALIYEIAKQQGWKVGETLERAIAALQRELGWKKS